MSYVSYQRYFICFALFTLSLNLFTGLLASEFALSQGFQPLRCAALSNRLHPLIEPFMDKDFMVPFNVIGSAKGTLHHVSKNLFSVFLTFHHARLHSKLASQLISISKYLPFFPKEINKIVNSYWSPIDRPLTNPVRKQLVSLLRPLSFPPRVKNIIASYCSGFTLGQQLWQELDAYQEHVASAEENSKNRERINFDAYEISVELQIMHYIAVNLCNTRDFLRRISNRHHLVNTMHAIKLFNTRKLTEHLDIESLQIVTNGVILKDTWYFMLELIPHSEMNKQGNIKKGSLPESTPAILIIDTIESPVGIFPKLTFERSTGHCAEYKLISFSHDTPLQLTPKPPYSTDTIFLFENKALRFRPSQDVHMFTTISKEEIHRFSKKERGYQNTYNFCYCLTYDNYPL